MSAESRTYKSEIQKHLRRLYQVKADKKELEVEEKEIKKEIQELMLSNNLPQFEDPETRLRAKVLENKPRRTFAFDDVKENLPDVYRGLENQGFIGLSKVKVPYKLDVRSYKPKGAID